MTNFGLSYFRLQGNWNPLFELLPTWRLHHDSDVWSDGVSVVEVSKNSRTKLTFGFVVDDDPGWTKLISRLRKLNVSAPNVSVPNEIRVMTPSGIEVKLRKQLSSQSRQRSNPPILMNHVAINVTEIAAERQWYEALFGNCTVLARKSAWEPVSNSHVRDVHLFRSPEFYITLRETGNVSDVDHVGWMTKDSATVDQMAAIVRQLGWPIVFGPAEIDGSYLFHFTGPDRRVHDFFFPTTPLVQASQRSHELESG
jgi:hypothetical protein